jgi:hypothetical protein
LGLGPKHDLRDGFPVYIFAFSLTQGERIRRNLNQLAWVRSCRRGAGIEVLDKLLRLWPFVSSEVDPLGQFEGVIDLDPEIPDGALDLPVSEEQLAGPQISRGLID